MEDVVKDFGDGALRFFAIEEDVKEIGEAAKEDKAMCKIDCMIRKMVEGMLAAKGSVGKRAYSEIKNELKSFTEKCRNYGMKMRETHECLAHASYQWITMV